MEDVFDSGEEFACDQGFKGAFADTHFESFVDGGLFGKPSAEDDGHARANKEYFFGKLDSGHAWHGEVGDDEVKIIRVAFKGVKSILSV